jgi:hypothetical protein
MPGCNTCLPKSWSKAGVKGGFIFYLPTYFWCSKILILALLHMLNCLKLTSTIVILLLRASITNRIHTLRLWSTITCIPLLILFISTIVDLGFNCHTNCRKHLHDWIYLLRLQAAPHDQLRQFFTYNQWPKPSIMHPIGGDGDFTGDRCGGNPPEFGLSLWDDCLSLPVNREFHVLDARVLGSKFHFRVVIIEGTNHSSSSIQARNICLIITAKITTLIVHHSLHPPPITSLPHLSTTILPQHHNIIDSRTHL